MVYLSKHSNALDISGLQSPVSSLPIGIFDSGVGGLTVLKAVQQLLPNESVIYLGDTARLPYGTKTPDEIVYFVRMILNWMLTHPVKMVIMACNTSSALALEMARTEFTIPILGVIRPAVQSAVVHGNRIGVIATPATASSHAYRAVIHAAKMNARVWEIGCPEFVPLIEEDQVHTQETRNVVQRYLDPLLERKIDTLIYGCTHYPLLSPVISGILPPTVQLIDPAIHVAAMACKVLKDQKKLRKRKRDYNDVTVTRFFVSDRPHRFSQVATRLLGYTPLVKEVDMGIPLSNSVSSNSRNSNRSA